MSLRIRYNRVTTAGGVEPDTITARAGVSFSSAAEEGSVGMSQIIVDDTANALDYVGRRRVYAYETACQAHNQIVFNGYLQKRWIGRIPPEGPDQDAEVMGRRWTLDIGDTNSLLSRRLITGADGDRPAETDIARIQWLLDSNDAYLSNPQDNWENPSPYVDTAGPISMSAASYIGRTAFDVLNDCAQRSGKNWFVRYYEANDSVPPTNAGSYALWYADAESTLDTSTLRLTNVDADVDDVTTFAVLPDAQLSRDPTRAYSGIYLTYDGGSRYQQSTNVVNLFQRQDAAVSNPFVKTDAEAAALTTRYLDDAETEDDRLPFRFICAKQYVNDLREGQRFSGKFSHLATDSGPDYSTWTWWRCLRRTVTHLNDEFYEVSGEASPIPCIPAVTQQGEFLYPGGAHGNDVQMPFTPAAGSFLLAYVGYRDHPWVTLPGWTLHDQRTTGGSTDTTGWAWRIADGTEVYFNTTYASGKYGYVYAFSCATGASSLTSTYTESPASSMSTMTAAAVSAPGPGIVLGGFAISGGPGNADHRAGGAYPPVVPGSGYTLTWTGQEEFHPMMSIVSKSISGAGSHTPSASKDGNALPTVYNAVWDWLAWAIAVTRTS